MKRISIITSADGGGAERMSLLYGKILERAGYNISLVVIKFPENDFLLSSFIPKHWKTIVIDKRFRYHFFYLVKSIRFYNPDIAFCSMADCSLFLLLAKALRLINCQCVIRSCNMPSSFRKSIFFFSKLLFRFSDLIIAQTEEMRLEIIHSYYLKSNNLITINNPIDKDLIDELINNASSPFSAKYVNYVAVGRVEPQKDYVTLLKAFSIVVKKQPLSQLYIVGRIKNSAYKSKLDYLIDKYRLRDNVVFEGFQPNPYRYMKDANVFCLSSIYEGLPNVMLEAMYLGKPIVATSCIPFIPQVIKNGVNGYCCDIGDYQSLANKMLRAKDIFIDKNNIEFALSDTESLIINSFNQLCKN